jgi:hypothetical protein
MAAVRSVHQRVETGNAVNGVERTGRAQRDVFVPNRLRELDQLFRILWNWYSHKIKRLMVMFVPAQSHPVLDPARNDRMPRWELIPARWPAASQLFFGKMMCFLANMMVFRVWRLKIRIRRFNIRIGLFNRRVGMLNRRMRLSKWRTRRLNLPTRMLKWRTRLLNIPNQLLNWRMWMLNRRSRRLSLPRQILRRRTQMSGSTFHQFAFLVR